MFGVFWFFGSGDCPARLGAHYFKTQAQRNQLSLAKELSCQVLN